MEGMLKELVEKDKEKRQQECDKEIGAILEKYHCLLVPRIILFGDEQRAEIVVVALTE